MQITCSMNFSLERYNTYVKTIVGGEPVTPFSMDLTRDMNLEKKLANPRVAELVRELSRLKYGKDISTIEAAISQRARL